MKSKRTWLAGILSIVMTMTFMPTQAFAAEETENGNSTDAVWTVVSSTYWDEETTRENYDTLQDAMDHGTIGEGYAVIELNRDASGKGCFEGTYSMESKDYTIDFKGHTYTVTEGVSDEQGSGATAINLKGSCYGTFRNGTLKIKNCATGIKSYHLYMEDFNIDASENNDCKNALRADEITLKGNSSVKVQPGNNAIEARSGSIKTSGIIQGTVVDTSEENLKIYNGLFTEKPEAQYIAKGYEVKASADGLFEVAPTEEYAPLLKKIQSLREECDKAEKSLASDKKEADESIEKIQKNLENAETNLNDGLYDKDIDKAISEAEISIREAKEELNKLKALITQKDKEYKEEGKKLQGECDSLDAEMKDIDESKCDFEDFNIWDIRYPAERMETVFSSEKDEDGEECNAYVYNIEVMSENLDELEIKLDKVKKLPSRVNKEMTDALEETKKELDAAKDSLDKVNQKTEDLNKKLDALIEDLQKTQEQLKKAEEQLKNQNSTPTPSATPVKKPGQVKGLKLKAGKKKVTVTYKKVSGATSYKVTYSTGKKFKKAKTVTVKSGKTVKKTISKLKSKKTYYVKVCAVKRVSGKNYTGKWSAVKKVKVK